MTPVVVTILIGHDNSGNSVGIYLWFMKQNKVTPRIQRDDHGIRVKLLAVECLEDVLIWIPRYRPVSVDFDEVVPRPGPDPLPAAAGFQDDNI